MTVKRYALDRHGRLWPYRHRHFVKAVAIVTVRAHKPKAAKSEGVAETVAPEPVCSTASLHQGDAPLQQSRPRKLAIDLRTVPSGMELKAESWKGNR